MITVVGLGPAGPEHLTARTLQAIDAAEIVWLRTTRHPSVAAVLERRPDAGSFDELYESEPTFEAVYEAIVAALVESAGRAGGARAVGGHSVCYAVPGSPMVGERSVVLLAERLALLSPMDSNLDHPAADPPDDPAADPLVGPGNHLPPRLRIEPAVSYLDLAWNRLGIDPMAEGVRLLDASTIGTELAGWRGPSIVTQPWSRQLLSDVKLSIADPSPRQRAVILHHLGLHDELVVDVEWADLDRTIEPDHLTSVYIPALARPPAAEITELAATVGYLRERCPWDREQTHATLIRHLLEETYEAIEALEALGDDPAVADPDTVHHAVEELGDLLCQVVFHSTLGEEEGIFTLSDVAASITEKLISRHPHVFSPTSDSAATVKVTTAAEVLDSWERSKDREKQRSHLLEGIPDALPALARAEKIERKLRSVGLGWTPREDITFERLSTDQAGDLLLAITRSLGARGIDAETALRHAIERCSHWLLGLEEQARQQGVDLATFVAENPDLLGLPG